MGPIAGCAEGPGHQASGPYGFRPESAVFADRVIEVITADRLADLAALDSGLVMAAAADSGWQMLMLSGAIETSCNG